MVSSIDMLNGLQIDCFNNKLDINLRITDFFTIKLICIVWFLSIFVIDYEIVEPSQLLN